MRACTIVTMCNKGKCVYAHREHILQRTHSIENTVYRAHILYRTHSIQNTFYREHILYTAALNTTAPERIIDFMTSCSFDGFLSIFAANFSHTASTCTCECVGRRAGVRERSGGRKSRGEREIDREWGEEEQRM